MKIYFSKSTKGFHRETDGLTSIPSDAVEISLNQFNTLINGQTAGNYIQCDDGGVPYITTPKPVQTTYIEQRVAAYPSIADQLDTIYHEGIDAWKAQIAAVKEQYPKGAV